jgi:hypothetical protein
MATTEPTNAERIEALTTEIAALVQEAHALRSEIAEVNAAILRLAPPVLYVVNNSTIVSGDAGALLSDESGHARWGYRAND